MIYKNDMVDASLLICPRCRYRAASRRCPYDGAFLISPRALEEAPDDPRLGTLVANQYAIVQRLGVGGMGAVYRARDEVSGRPIAIKFLLEQYAHHLPIRARFEAEAAASLAIDHPNVVKLINFGIEVDHQMWIAMEFVQGWTLRDEVNHNGPFTIEQAIRLCRQVLQGLSATHDAHLIHRDLKHDNIMFTGTRENFRARILDFGVVKSNFAEVLAAEQEKDLNSSNPGAHLPKNQTGNGLLVGSPSYMSPEQIRGLDVHPAADLYSLGVILYEILTGRRLFSANDYETLLHEGARRDVPPLYFTGRKEPVPAAFNRFLQRCLETDPADRFPDANTMLLALDQLDITPEIQPDDLLSDMAENALPLDEDWEELTGSTENELTDSVQLNGSDEPETAERVIPNPIHLQSSRRFPGWLSPCIAAAFALFTYLILSLTL